MKKRILSMIISAALCISILPTGVWAQTVGSETVRFEAEDYVPSGNRVNDGDASKWSGEKAAGSHAVEAEIEVETAGIYEVSVKWGNRFGDNRNVELKANDTVLFSGKTGITYSTKVNTYTAELNAGINTISITSPDNNMGNFRIDYFEISPSSVLVLNNDTVRLEAENYPDGTLYTNEDTAFSNGTVARSTKMRADIYVAIPGVYKVDVRWGNRYGDKRNVELKVGDEVLFTGSVTRTYGVDVQSFAAELKAGLHTVTIVSPDNNLGNFWADYVEFSPIDNLVPLAKDATIKLEAEDYNGDGTDETLADAYKLSGGSRALNSNIEVNVYAEEAGTYEIKASWGSGQGNSFPAVILNGVTTGVSSSLVYWELTVAHANVTLNKGLNSIKIAKGSKLWVDYIKISPASVLSADKTLRLEAEDYTSTKIKSLSTRHFDSGNAYVFNDIPMETEISVTDGGEYTMTLASGGMSGSSPKVAVLIDDQEVYNKWNGVKVEENANELQEGCVGLSQTKVTLSAGTHTIKIVPELHALVDYVEFSKPADYAEESYSYYLTETNVDSADLTTALTSTYLGAYSGEYDETMLNSAVKALDADMSFVYWPFTTSATANYYLKVTYASAEESDAVCIVDPQTLPTVADKDYDTILADAKAVTGSKWQKAYSNEAGTFSAPYFAEKYFNVGTLLAGDHNFVFMYNPADETNKGVSIRKVELVSSDKIAAELISAEAQFAAEVVGDSDSTSTAKLVSSISEANTYSSASALDEDKNQTIVIKNIYNNSGDVADFTFIAASYDSNGKLIDCASSENFTIGAGYGADAKVKVNTAGAEHIKTFILNMENLNPVFESELFGK